MSETQVVLSEPKLILVCPKGHKTELKPRSVIRCRICDYRPQFSWNGDSHYFYR